MNKSIDEMTAAELRMAIAQVQGWQNIRRDEEGALIAEEPDIEGCEAQVLDTVALPDWPNDDSESNRLLSEIIETENTVVQTGIRYAGPLGWGHYEAWVTILSEHKPMMTSAHSAMNQGETQGALENLRRAICIAYLKWRGYEPTTSV